MRTVAAIVGPTSVGKTEIAFKIALRWGVSIVSCDARQVYKYMDIGTAKPSKKIRNTVSHYMIDIVEPNERYTAYDYARDGRKVIAKLESPIIVGGSGLYLRALIDGLFPMPRIDLTLRQRLSLRSAKELYMELMRIDKPTADRLHPNDRVRIIRALEVYKDTGKPISEWRKGVESVDFQVEYLGVHMEREELYKKIEERVDSMITDGLVKEVEFLLDRYGETMTILSSIGYCEIFSYLKGDIDLGKAIYLTKRNTKRYVKRQLTWFRHIKGIKWLPAELLLENFTKSQALRDGDNLRI